MELTVTAYNVTKVEFFHIETLVFLMRQKQLG